MQRVIHFEIYTEDPEAVQPFYRDVFGWKFKKFEGGPIEYWLVTTGDDNYVTGSASTIDANIGQYYHDYIGNYYGSYGAGSPVNRFFPSLGNHDWITRSGTPALPTPYLNYFTLPGNERYHTFTHGPVQFFAIDSGDGSGTITDGFEPDGYSITPVQAQWPVFFAPRILRP